VRRDFCIAILRDDEILQKKKILRLSRMGG
jgi:hypothetical protein